MDRYRSLGRGPRLSVADGKIYTIARYGALGSGSAGLLPSGSAGGVADTYKFTVIDAATGTVDSAQSLGATTVQDTLQMVGTIAPGRVQYQGTLSGLFRITPASPGRPSTTQHPATPHSTYSTV